jgi:hypothetical protein
MAAASDPELSPFDYEGYRFANERLRALEAAGDPRGETRNVRGVIDGIVENYAQALVHHQPAPGNVLVVNTRTAKIVTHALQNYGVNVGAAFSSVRFVFGADFPDREIRSDVWNATLFPNIEVVAADDEDGGGGAARAAAWRNGPVALVGVHNSGVRRFHIRRCLTREVYADLAHAVGGFFRNRLTHVRIRVLLDEDEHRTVATLVRSLISPSLRRGYQRHLEHVCLPLVATLRSYTGEAEDAPGPTGRIERLTLVHPSGRAVPPLRDSRYPGVDPASAWRWLSAGPGIGSIHASGLSCLDPSDWAAVTDWRAARAAHLVPPVPANHDRLVVLEHRVAPATAPHYARRSVVGRPARHLRVIVHNDGTDGTLPSSVAVENVFVDESGREWRDGSTRMQENPLYWSEVDDQAQFYKDAIDPYNIRSFGGMVVLTPSFPDMDARYYGPNEWVWHVFRSFIYAAWPALLPVFVRLSSAVPTEGESSSSSSSPLPAYRVRLLLDASRVAKPRSMRDTSSTGAYRRDFQRALSDILLEYLEVAAPVEVGGERIQAMQDAVMALWDAGDIRVVTPDTPEPSVEERNAFLMIPSSS